MTTEPQEQVIQADKDAAEAFLDEWRPTGEGNVWSALLSQAFAHRRLHTPEACQHCGAPKHLCDKLEGLSSPPVEGERTLTKNVTVERAAIFDILRRHNVSEQCFAEVAMATYSRERDALVEALREIVRRGPAGMSIVEIARVALANTPPSGR